MGGGREISRLPSTSSPMSPAGRHLQFSAGPKDAGGNWELWNLRAGLHSILHSPEDLRNDLLLFKRGAGTISSSFLSLCHLCRRIDNPAVWCRCPWEAPLLPPSLTGLTSQHQFKLGPLFEMQVKESLPAMKPPSHSSHYHRAKAPRVD